jgi:hypothetical protein
MCMEGVIFGKINKRDFTFIREMRVHTVKDTAQKLLNII